MKFDKLFEEVMNGPKEEDSLEFIKSIPVEQLIKIFREDLHIYFQSIEGTAHEDAAQDRIQMIGNELLAKGLMPEDLDTIYKQIHDEASNASEEPQHDEYEHKGWPGDGSGEDDFADYNQMEGDDY